MDEKEKAKLLFIINPGSGVSDADWEGQIKQYFLDKPFIIKLAELDESCSPELVTSEIKSFKPDRIIAVGGDGTVKLVCTCILGQGIPLGILPAGSANGMAKELGIPIDIPGALEVVQEGVLQNIHLVKINNEICIHLADIGFNAFVIKEFDKYDIRGMWGYMKAAWKVLWRHPKMDVEIKIQGESVKSSAAMVVIANATKYGSGALINPVGRLDDDLFEVIVVKKISPSELFKMMVTHLAYNPAKTEVFQTGSLHIKSRIKAHFQVDGEYLGKIDRINAEIIKDAVQIIVPKPEKA